MFRYLKNKFLWWKLHREQKKRHKHQDQFNALLDDILAKIKRNLKQESIIIYYFDDEVSYKIVYDVYLYLKSIGYDICFLKKKGCDFFDYCTLSIKLR